MMGEELKPYIVAIAFKTNDAHEETTHLRHGIINDVSKEAAIGSFILKEHSEGYLLNKSVFEARGYRYCPADTEKDRVMQQMAEALAFYGSRANYEKDFGDKPVVYEDYGDKARQALAALEKIGGE